MLLERSNQVIPYSPEQVELAARRIDASSRIDVQTPPGLIDVVGGAIAKGWSLPHDVDSSKAVGNGVRVAFDLLRYTDPEQVGQIVKNDLHEKLNGNRRARRSLGKFVRSTCVEEYDTTSLHPELEPMIEILRSDPTRARYFGINTSREMRRKNHLPSSFRQTITAFDILWNKL